MPALPDANGDAPVPFPIEGTLAGERVRKALDLTNLEAASARIRRWEAAGKLDDPPEPRVPAKTISALRTAYLENCRARRISAASIKKFGIPLSEFATYAERNGIAGIEERRSMPSNACSARSPRGRLA